MEIEHVLIHVNNQIGDDNNDGAHADRHGSHGPVATADRAFSLLPPYWHGRAEIIFENTGEPYRIETSTLCFGTPIGPEALPLVIRGGYTAEMVVAAPGSTDDKVVTTTGISIADQLIGAVLMRQSSGLAISIRGNSTPDPLGGVNSAIFLQRTINPSVVVGETFMVQRPAVTLAPTQTLNLTSHDGRSPNLTLIGIKIEPVIAAGLNLHNIRARCDTCDFSLQRATGPDTNAVTLYVHTNSRIQGGSDDRSDLRAQAGLYIHSNDPSNIVWAVRGGILGGHLTFEDITVRVSQGGSLVPKSLEALRTRIRIMAGGAALAEGQGWGTLNNKARIRNVLNIIADPARSILGDPGDGLRVTHGGWIHSPLFPIHLDIFECERDGIHLDNGSLASFGPSGGDAGLVTTQGPNLRFGMNVRNGSRAFVGRDAATAGVPPDATRPKPLRGAIQVALDDGEARLRGRSFLWANVVTLPQSNERLSLVSTNA